MDLRSDNKVSNVHLQRDAYLYIRQSSMRQVLQNTESKKRQYALREQALCLGWKENQIQVIDDDLGESAAHRGREGFAKLVSEVGIGKAGIVCSLEVSRFARNSSDWHHLLEICALTKTLILDEDGVYDPAHFNDRLLLGLKGTMSEAELHVLRARLIGGMLHKARRGELKMRLPIGFVYDVSDRVVIDPDLQIQNCIRKLFKLFREKGSILQTVRSFNRQGLLFPTRLYTGVKKGEVVWKPLSQSRCNQILHNPRYTGAYAYGRRQPFRNIVGKKSLIKEVPQEKWYSLIHNAHKGYISWNGYEENLQQLKNNMFSVKNFKRSAPREGSALLQGIVYCGLCGYMMSVHYYQRRDGIKPWYECRGRKEKIGERGCQSMPGVDIDHLVEKTILQKIKPVEIEIALKVQKQIQENKNQLDEIHRQQVERIRYETELAQRRYMRVDPDNRLVAVSLEEDWNEKLRVLQNAQNEYTQQQKNDPLLLDENTKNKIVMLSQNFPIVWNNQKTSYREKKRMIRLILEDVTLQRDKHTIKVYIRFKSGRKEEFEVPVSLPYYEKIRIDKMVVKEINYFLEDKTASQIALILNEKGMFSGTGKKFNADIVNKIKRAYGLKSRYNRLRDRGLLTRKEMVVKLNVDPKTIVKWRKKGKLKAHLYDGRSRYLYEDPEKNN